MSNYYRVIDFQSGSDLGFAPEGVDGQPDTATVYAQRPEGREAGVVSLDYASGVVMGVERPA